MKEGKTLHIRNKMLQSKLAYLSGLNFQGKHINHKLRLPEGSLFEQNVQKPKPFLGSIAKHVAAGCAAMGAVIVEHVISKNYNNGIRSVSKQCDLLPIKTQESVLGRKVAWLLEK